MAMSPDPRFDFIVVKPRDGVDRAEIEVTLIKNMGAKPDKIHLLLNHLAEKGPVVVEKAVNAAKLEELRQKWEAAGLVTASKEVLAILEDDAPTEQVAPTSTCPACGHKQEKKGEADPCEKCGVFPHKFAEEQRKKEIIQKERDRLEKMAHFARQKEDQESKERREKEEIEEIRKKLEEEMGLKKKPKGLAAFFAMFTTGGPVSPAIKGVIGAGVLGLMLAAGWFGHGAFSPAGPSAEATAKLQAAQAQQSGNAMQKAVGQMIIGSKKMAQQSGAAEQFSKEIFPQGDRDADLQEQMQATTAGNAEIQGALAEGDRAAGLAEAAKGMAEAGNIEQSERALAMSMQSASSIKDDKQRTERVSAVAGTQFEVYTNDARQKAATGDWRAADKAFSKAMNAATDITTQSEAAVARSNVARARADTGDYGGAALIFLDAVKTAEEVGDPRERALALADVAKNLAEASNEMGGAAERAFDKALAAAASLPKEGDKAAATNVVLLRRLEAAGSIAGFLMTAEGGADALKATLERAAKDAEQMTDPMLQVRAFGTLARVTAESQGAGQAIDGYMGRIAKLVQSAPEQQRDLVAAPAARAKAETLAAAAKFNAGKADRPAAKQGFIQAMQAANAVATKSADPRVKSEFAKQRSEALGAVARYMQAAGDKKAAARVFALAVETGAAR